MHVSKTDLQQSSLIDTSNLRESLCFPAGLSIQSALGLQRGAILMQTATVYLSRAQTAAPTQRPAL